MCVLKNRTPNAPQASHRQPSKPSGKFHSGGVRMCPMCCLGVHAYGSMDTPMEAPTDDWRLPGATLAYPIRQPNIQTPSSLFNNGMAVYTSMLATTPPTRRCSCFHASGHRGRARPGPRAQACEVAPAPYGATRNITLSHNML